MNQDLPKIGVVIIGINESDHLADCIRSVQSSKYPLDLIEIVYVDGGSRDNSPEIAREFDTVKVIELRDAHPTPGRGRNVGWKMLDTTLIQFLDADTILNPLWFKEAVSQFYEPVVAVCGFLKEKHPNKNWYHIIADMEWFYEIGPCSYFGGGVLLKKDVLEKTGGFDEALVAGEDPELSYRIRQIGGMIYRLDTLMVTHDINMNSWRNYFKRSYRSGYAFTEICLRFIREKEKMWLKKLIGIFVRVLLPNVIILAGFCLGHPFWGIVLGLLIILKQFLKIPKIKQIYSRSWKNATLYAVHFILVDYPQFLGSLRYFLGQIIHKPFRNKGYEGTKA